MLLEHDAQAFPQARSKIVLFGNKFRIFMRGFIIVAFINLVSCSENSIVSTEDNIATSSKISSDEGNIGIVIEPEMAGILHNEILSEFNKKHPIRSGPLDENVFVKYYQESVNTVFKKNGIPIVVSEKQVRSDLLLLKKITALGVFNFFSPPQKTNVEAFISYGINTKKSTHAESECIRKVFNSLKGGVQFPEDFARIQLLKSEIESTKGVDANSLVSICSIAQSTSEFWSDFLINPRDGETSDLAEVNDEYIWRTTCDICGGIIGLWTGVPGGSIVLGGLASVAFHILYNEGPGWWETITGWFN